MKKRALLGLVLISFLLFCIWGVKSALAYPSYQGPGPSKATQVASLFAQQPVSLSCEPTGQAWGWVLLSVPIIHLDPLICDRLIDIQADRYEGTLAEYGIAVLVLTHESYHLRKSWSARGNEAKVECAAIRHVLVSEKLLGVPERLLRAVKLGALYYHWLISRLDPAYYLEACKVPRA